MKKILLGSASPRRRELLAQMGVSFNLASIECEEDFDPKMIAEEVPVYLSHKKSMAYGGMQENEVLITADTVVRIDDRILNKPGDGKEAYDMLRSMCGRNHQVTTGVTLRSLQKTESFGVSTEVSVSEFTDEEINYYIRKYKPYDKAGAYGIQEWFGLACVSGIVGCFYNVVGLPTWEVYKRLKNSFNAI